MNKTYIYTISLDFQANKLLEEIANGMAISPEEVIRQGLNKMYTNYSKRKV